MPEIEEFSKRLNVAMDYAAMAMLDAGNLNDAFERYGVSLPMLRMAGLSDDYCKGILVGMVFERQRALDV